MIAKYASEHGVNKAVKRYQTKIDPGETIVVDVLPVKKCGRPPLLGEKLDKY